MATCKIYVGIESAICRGKLKHDLKDRVRVVFVEETDLPFSRRLRLRLEDTDVVPLTFSVGLVHRWTREGRHHCDLWQKLDPVDHVEISAISTQLAESWYQPFLGALRHGDLHPAELCKQDMIPVFAWAATVQRAIIRAFTEIHPRQLTVTTNLNRPSSGYINPHNDIASAVIIHEAQQLGAKIDLLPLQPNLSNGTSQVRTPQGNSNSQPLRAVDQDILSEILERTHAHPVCLQISNHTDYQLQQPLCEELRRRGFYIVSAIYGGGGSPDPTTGRLRLEPFLKLPWPDSDLRQKVDRAWCNFTQQQPLLKGAGAELLSNPLLNFQYRAFYDGVVAGAQWYEAVTRLAGLIEPDVCLIGLDVIGLRRCAYEALRTRGIPTIQYQHGLICDFELHDFRSDFLFVPGQLHLAEHVRRGRSAERVVIVGDPTVPPAAATPTTVFHGDGAGAPSHDSSIARILAITATTTVGSRWVLYDGYRHRQAWETLVHAIESRANTSLLIKPHPRYDDLALYRDFAESECVEIVSRHRDLNTCLNEAEVVVLVNAATSAAIHAMAQQKPVVYILNAESIPHGDANANILRNSGAVVVSDLNDLAHVIDSLLEDRSAREQVLDRQNTFLREFVPIRETAATERMADFLETQTRNKICQEHVSPTWTAGRLTWKYVKQRTLGEFLVGVRRLAWQECQEPGTRFELAKELAAWLALWSDEYDTILQNGDVQTTSARRLAVECGLDSVEARRLETLAFRAEAYRRHARGDVSGMRRCAWAAIVRANPLWANRDLSRMLITSLMGPTTKGWLNKIRSVCIRGRMNATQHV